MRDSVPGEDGERLIMLMKGGEEVTRRIIRLVQFMFNNDADKGELKEKEVTRIVTSYRHGTSEGLSDPWVLARGLREVDPSSPVLKKEGWRWESGKFVHFCLYLANPLHCLFRRVLHLR